MLPDFKMEEIARGNIEQFLEVEDENDIDSIFNEAYTLGVDALLERGIDPVIARNIAYMVAQGYAQP